MQTGGCYWSFHPAREMKAHNISQNVKLFLLKIPQIDADDRHRRGSSPPPPQQHSSSCNSLFSVTLASHKDTVICSSSSPSSHSSSTDLIFWTWVVWDDGILCQNSKRIYVFFFPSSRLAARWGNIERRKCRLRGEGKCQINNKDGPREAVEEAIEIRQGVLMVQPAEVRGVYFQLLWV